MNSNTVVSGVFITILLFSANTHAQNVDVIQNTVTEQQRQLRDQQQRLTPTPKSATTLPPVSKQAAATLPAKGGSCFEVKETQVESPPDFSVPDWATRLNQQCADAHALGKLLNDLNQHYQAQGLMTTRAYLPKQNLKSGALIVIIKPGTLERFEYLDGKAADARIQAAFPLQAGDVIELRRLEQGLDNFNKPDSQSGKFKLFPGSEQGQSIVKIEAQNKKPWQLKMGLDNSGYDSTGEAKGSLDFTYDNLLGVNDSLALGINSNLDEDGHKRESDSANVRLSVPYKNGSWSLMRSHSEFFRIIAGVNQNYRVDGNSRVTALGYEHLLHRDQDSKVYAWGNLARKRSRNYIEDYEIQTQRRNLTVASAGVRGEEKYPNKRKLDWNVGAKWGVGAFDAMGDIPGPAIARFKAIKLSFNYEKPLQSGGKYIATVSAQGSEDELPGSEQFGAGGRYDVRGFHEDALFGNTGFFLRNTWESKARKNGEWEFTPYAGFDIGWVEEPATVAWNEPIVVGAVLGGKVKVGKYWEADMSYAHALHGPDEFQGKDDQVYFHLSVKF